MADISAEINQIRTAVYGEQVRSSIVTALMAMNDQVNNLAVNLGGIRTFDMEISAGGSFIETLDAGQYILFLGLPSHNVLGDTFIYLVGADPSSTYSNKQVVKEYTTGSVLDNISITPRKTDEAASTFTVEFINTGSSSIGSVIAIFLRLF